MRTAADRLTIARAALGGLSALLIGYLTVIAAWPGVREFLPTGVQWFGRPNSAVTLAIVTAVLVLLGVVLSRSRGQHHRSGAPVAIVAGLAVLTALLGMASYWRCQDDSHPDFFTMLLWTAGLVKGGDPVQSLDSGVCPYPTPVALQLAQLSAVAAVFLSVVGVAVALFQARLDRLRVYFARSVTAVIGLDDDSSSMLAAVAQTVKGRSTLVVITADPDRPCVREARTRGARVLVADPNQPESLAALPIWGKIDRLYLMSADASANLMQLRTITDMFSGTPGRQRIPLIVRIDDPWQAASWRDERLGGTDTHWAPDAVGRYEVTARRLLDEITGGTPVRQILVCGMSQLALALCADMAQRRLEFDYHAEPGQTLPELVLVGADAKEYLADHDYARRQAGAPSAATSIRAVSALPTVSALGELLTEEPSSAVILTDHPGLDTTTGTRLAARHPGTPIYAYEPGAATGLNRVPLVGQLHTYRLSLDVPSGAAQDAWERAARLIHNRYVAGIEAKTAAAVPWEQLDEFYRGSNRRQVRNALWMVEEVGGHTWNTWGHPPDSVPTTRLRDMEPLEALRCMGFDEDTALAMARAEHEDWCRYYRAAGWRYGPVRDDARKIHDKLTTLSTSRDDPALLSALTSLVATLSKLRELGYRSRPLAGHGGWQRFQRTGTVIADQRNRPWSWTTASGHTLHAGAGDWAVREADGSAHRSVRDDIFRASHEYLGDDRWRRTGTVTARPAEADEVVETLEGRVTAQAGDWVVRGEAGECWPVPAADFAQRYRPVDE